VAVCMGTTPGCIVFFDISFVDTSLGRYLLADRTNKAIDVVDTGTNALLHQFGQSLFIGFTGDNDTSGPNGVLTAANHTEIWAGDGPHNSAPVFPTPAPVGAGTSDLRVLDTSGNPLAAINTHGYYRVDEGCYDPKDNIQVWANDAEADYNTSSTPAAEKHWPFISFIKDVSPYPILGTITMDGGTGAGHGPKATNGIEQCQWSPKTGKIYVNLPEVNGPGNDSVAGAVLVINPVTRTIEKTFTISHDSCAGPQGMAIGPNNQILLGCNADSGNGKHSTVLINQNSGAVIAVLDNESGADEVWYNQGDGQYFLARSSAFGLDQKLGVVDSVGHREDESLTTGTKPTTTFLRGRNAHSVAADSAHVPNQVYVPIPAAVSTVCSSVGGNDHQGCIAVFTTKNDDRPRTVLQRPQDDHQE
jgi:hypothetical protein